jgi:hypothetical protein
MAAWHNQPFAARSKRMGKDAEEHFERWAAEQGLAIDRFGFDLPPFTHFGKMSDVMRYAPDYCVEERQEHYFVECKGVGRDGIVKIKVEQIDNLAKWEAFSEQRVDFFVYSSSTKLVSPRNSLKTLLEIVPHVPLGAFNDWGTEKPYYAIPTDLLTWEETDAHKRKAA